MENKTPHPSYSRLVAALRKALSDPALDGTTNVGAALETSAGAAGNWQARGVSKDAAEAAQLRYGINAAWVRKGEGPEFIKASPISPSENAPGYLRLGLLDGVGGMGNGVVNEDFPEVIREMQFSEQRLRALFGFMPRPGRLALMTGRGHSMDPVIQHGDVVMVDTQTNFFDGDGPYVINLGAGQQIKNLQDRGDGIYIVSANKDAGLPAFKAPDDLLIGGKVHVVQKFIQP